MPISTILDAHAPVIRLTGEIDLPVSYALLDELNLLHDYYQFREVELHIDSPGGSADALQFLVHALAPWRKGEGRVLRTFGMQDVASAAAMLLSFGTVGHRAAAKHSRLLYHSVRTVQRETTIHTVAQLRRATRSLEDCDRYFVDLLIEHTCDTADSTGVSAYRRKLTRLMRRDRYISPEQAHALRLIDRVV